MNFTTIQILREINYSGFKVLKINVFIKLEVPNLIFTIFFKVLREINSRELKTPKMNIFTK